MDPCRSEVMAYGIAEAGSGSQAKHRQGQGGREIEEDDPQPAQGGSAGPQPPGGEVPSPRGQAGPQPRGPDPPGPLRGGQAEKHPRTVQHGEVGPGQGDPKSQLAGLIAPTPIGGSSALPSILGCRTGVEGGGAG